MWYVDGYTIDGSVHAVDITTETETSAGAKAIAALFPKWLKVKGGGLSYLDENGHPAIRGYVLCRIYFGSDGVNKGKNETGLKRFKALLKRIEWKYKQKFCGNFATEDQIRDLLK